ncbi:DinB family protein [Acinetobacter sp.]|jgi:uncharacterized damage-inducible protein DinB|uniref:DinB family protein n=1 Tax=Acinetobacter sp. TaxID=472 RepID=UPI002830408E|nr:DinB family protein [Acinetobacter sp.]MDR0237568.1 DinB family protein [Acinetobacter sp.]
MDFVKLFLYKQWSDQRLFKAIAQINQEKYLDDYNFAKQQFNHMLIVEELFRSRLENKKALHTQTNTEVLPAFDELQQRIEHSHVWWIKFVKQIELIQLSKVIHFQFIDKKTGSLSIEEILFHIINHGTYHRGNIAHALHHAQVTHPADTYTVYIHQHEPERRAS